MNWLNLLVLLMFLFQIFSALEIEARAKIKKQQGVVRQRRIDHAKPYEHVEIEPELDLYVGQFGLIAANYEQDNQVKK